MVLIVMLLFSGPKSKTITGQILICLGLSVCHKNKQFSKKKNCGYKALFTCFKNFLHLHLMAIFMLHLFVWNVNVRCTQHMTNLNNKHKGKVN